jgi:outer membrane receptor protein involved in Fe transport
MTPIATEARTRRRRLWAAGASVLVLGLWASPTLAQDEAAVAAADADADDDDTTIVVTGSRLATTGMETPVPVTAVQADELEAMDPTSLIASLGQLPQFYGNQTPNNSAFFTRSGTGTLNLRGLGVNRTLTLLNGRRFPSSSAFGGVDINVFPEAMIKGIETVTGGASAAYGTDAVAGVTNFLLDTDFEGLEANVQGGITSRGDNETWEAELAWGTSLGDRAHVLLSGAYSQAEGIHNYNGRDWYQSWGAIQVGGVWRDYPNVVSMNGSFDGIIESPNALIDNLQFHPDGSYSPFVPGSPATGGVGTGGARSSGGSGDDLGGAPSEVFTIWPDTDRYSAFAYADYDVTDNFTVFGQFVQGYNHQWQYNTPRGSLIGQPTAITIFNDNAFLPAALRTLMQTNNIASFSLRRMGSIEDIGQSYFEDWVTQDVGTLGFNGEIDNGGFLDGWKYEGFYQYGHSRRVWDQYALRIDRIFAAVDAVRDASGNIVCRVSTVAAGAAAFPGCQPLNLFGRGNASEGAVNYVLGNDPGVQISTPLYFANLGLTGDTLDYTTHDAKRNITTFNQHLAELSARGDLFDNWAGPVSLALGGSWRRETIFQVVQDQANRQSNHDGAYHPCSLATAASLGLRGLNAPDCNNTVAHQFSKVSNIQGKTTVKEAFAEVLFPLISDKPWMQSTVLNASGRWADYSGAGTIWAYKVGLDLSFSDEIRLRGTYSRDVRAGNLSERFDKTGGAGNVLDTRITAADTAACTAQNNPSLVCTNTYNVTIFSGGNPNILPEKADTFTAGVVYQPSRLPGFSASLDWYKVSINDAIATVGTNEVARRCLQDQEQQFCDLITYDATATTDAGHYPKIILVGNQFVNVARSRVEGVDFELGYRHDLALLGGDESIAARIFATYLIDRSDIGATGVVTRFDGLTGLAPDTGAAGQFPKFKATGNVTYRNGPFTGFLQGRLIGRGTRAYRIGAADASEGNNIADNSVPAVFYLDTRLSYGFEFGGADVELFVAATNLLDKDPPVTGTFSAFLGYSGQVNTQLFDVLGRRFTAGVKVKL